MLKQDIVLGGLGVLLGAALLSQNERRGFAQIPIPLNPHIAGLTVDETHITGIDFSISSYSSTALIDTGSSFPAISAETAKKINFTQYPLTEPLHGKADMGTRLLPLRIPGLGVFPTVFNVGYPSQPTLIPPDIFYPFYDVTFTSQFAIFKTKSFKPIIPYVKIEDLTASDQEIYKKGIMMPGKKVPLLSFSVGNIFFTSTLDTGYGLTSAISKHIANLIGVERYPKKFRYDNGDFMAVYLVPITIGGLVLNMELSVSPRNVGVDYTNVITCEEFLRRGILVTFTEHGVRFG